jgi:hypothetical protein
MELTRADTLVNLFFEEILKFPSENQDIAILIDAGLRRTTRPAWTRFPATTPAEASAPSTLGHWHWKGDIGSRSGRPKMGRKKAPRLSVLGFGFRLKRAADFRLVSYT